MATQTRQQATFDTGRCLVEVVYDDVTLVAATLRVTNNGGGTFQPIAAALNLNALLSPVGPNAGLVLFDLTTVGPLMQTIAGRGLMLPGLSLRWTS